MLGSARIVAFAPTTDYARARAFYVETLGLSFVSQDQFALVVDSNGTKVRISKVPEFAAQRFTILGWDVSDIDEVVSRLKEKGVSCEKFGLPGQDERGIWTAPAVDNNSSGARVAWFKDPDGNVLSVTQFA
jgi:catechol 2,3-dioxygenase-like lactoylglutathione lyase family enzyme